MKFPEGFLWGAATAGHQIEGNNVNSDWWELEHRAGTPCAEPSGDACDSYHRYLEDISIVTRLGLGSYRFSLEWSRIEPEPGHFSRAARDHYRRVVEGVLSAGLVPTVTLQHFTVPRWFRDRGGWAAADAPELFMRYCEFVVPLLGEAAYVCTINEPNIASSLARLTEPGMMRATGLPEPDPRISDGLTAAHDSARGMLRDVVGPRIGWAVATQVFRAVDGGENATRSYAYERETRFLEASRGDDWLGVQAYTRTLIGPDGPLSIPDTAERTLTGWEYYPAAAAEGLRDAARLAPGVPLLVTENGIATADDNRRIDYVRDALIGVHEAIKSGIDVRGYFYWSLLDNFEWASGYGPTFGLVAVDRQTFTRQLKPSARWLGSVARANGFESSTRELTDALCPEIEPSLG